MFYEGRTYQGAKGPVYPYPLLDRLSDAKKDVSYDAVYLENEFVKVCVLPEIGGRILSAVDKTNGYDFFYRQTVIKPALIGMLGAWISGGVEWNVPHHHRPTTFMPVDYAIAANADGSKTLWLSEIEWRHRMKWLVGLTLCPGRSFVEITVKIMNRTPFAHSILYFTNAAVHVNPGYQVIFPPDVEFGTQHAKCEFIRWPFATNVYGGVDYTAGVDVSWWKNHPSPLSIFAFESREDFFGGYDHSRRAGTCHFADHNVSPGKKFFTFANGPSGRMWDKILTDADGPYLELMAGAYSDNQPDYSWIEPYETKTVTEYWYPVRELGGIKNANRDAAVNLDVAAGRVRLALNTTSTFKGATAVLRTGKRALFEESVSVSPDRPYAREFPLPRGVKESDLRFALVDSSGREILSYQPHAPARRPMPKPVVPPRAPKDVKTSEELYLAGLRLEEFHSPALEPYPYYEEAVRRDPGDYRANTALGILYCKRGMWREAAGRLRAAVERITKNYTRPKDGEAYYYLGIAERGLGDWVAARDSLNRAAWSFAWRAASYCQLAEMALADGDLAAALSHIDQSLSFSARNTTALDLKTVILRNSGRLEEAAATARHVLDADPLDFWARNELVLLLRAAGRKKDAGKALGELQTLMRFDVQSHLELASVYANCRLWGDAIDVLSRVAPEAADTAVDPMVHYALGHYFEKAGDAGKAARHRRLAPKMPPRYSFPFRLESIGLLESAIRHNPSDARAHYCLGNLLYDIQPANAIRAWERSRSLDGSFSTVHRNLALAYARRAKDTKRAVAAMKKAVACAPLDPRLFLELDILLTSAGTAHEKRLSILERHHKTIVKRDDALLREIVLHIFEGNCDRAIELLDSRHFHIWEGGENSAHDVYVDAHLLRGRKSLGGGDARAALADFQAAALYPERFEMGEPYDGGRAAEVGYFIGTAFEALGNADNAKAAFRTATAKDKKGTYLAYYQGLALRRLGSEKKAVALFDDLVRVGREALSKGTGAGFFDKFGGRLSESVGRAQAHYLVGVGLLGKGRKAAARREFRKAVASNPNHLGAHTMLAGIR
jgi:tetratricopeptide (TPR) repeat protein